MTEHTANEYNNHFEDWDIDEYYDSTQPPNQWKLKKAFIEAHKTKFPKYRLLALANTFSNMEFMGARYIPEVEKQVNLLSSEVTEVLNYRNGRRDCLKRTFVAASDATRAKILKTNVDVKNIKQTSFIKETDEATFTNNTISATNVKTNVEYPEDTGQMCFVKREEDVPLKKSLSVSSETNLTLIERARSQAGVRGKMVLYLHPNDFSSYHIIFNSAAKAKIKFEIVQIGKQNATTREYKLNLDNEEIAREFAESEKKAKEALGPIALKSLQETCFSILVKSQVIGENVTKSELSETSTEPTYALPSDNKGAKMMRMMGWTGQGLGKNQDGIQKPVEANRCVSRMGLRLDQGNIKKIREVINNMLMEYARGHESYNLVFSSDYTNDERKIIHEMAQKLDLKSKSYGKKDQRQLVVCKKVDSWTLVAKLLACGGENVNYKLIPPTKIT